jgi:hypothetical protein
MPDALDRPASAGLFYSEDQPRVPAGSPEGGEFAKAGIESIKELKRKAKTPAPTAAGVQTVPRIWRPGAPQPEPPTFTGLSTPRDVAAAAAMVGKWETENYERRTEGAFAVHPETGVVLDKRGTVGKVSLSPVESAAIKDSIFTHNHPGANTGLSPADVAAAISCDVSEMRVVGRDYRSRGRYVEDVLVRPPGGWTSLNVKTGYVIKTPHDVASVVAAVGKAQHPAVGKTEDDEWNAIWTRLGERFGYTYTRRFVP